MLKFGMYEYPQESKQIVAGPELKSETEIDNQIDDLIRQLEAARKEAKGYIEKMNHEAFQTKN
ncbi:hypothetical protein [Desulfobacula sp.]